MKLNRYFSGTLEAAMAQARQEPGDDALLAKTHPATPVTRSHNQSARRSLAVSLPATGRQIPGDLAPDTGEKLSAPVYGTAPVAAGTVGAAA